MFEPEIAEGLTTEPEIAKSLETNKKLLSNFEAKNGADPQATEAQPKWNCL